MGKLLTALLLFFISTTAKADYINLLLSNSNMVQTSTSVGTISLDPIDAYNIPSFCSTIISPNSCTSLDSDTVRLTLVFDYALVFENNLNQFSSINIDYNISNGNSGLGLSPFYNYIAPSNLSNLNNNATGSSTLVLDIKLRGPGAAVNYGMEISADLILNP